MFLNHQLSSPSHAGIATLYPIFFNIPLQNHCISKLDDPPLAIYICELFWVHQQSSSIFVHHFQWSLSHILISIPKTRYCSSLDLLNVTTKIDPVYANVQSYLPEAGHYSYNSRWHPDDLEFPWHSTPSFIPWQTSQFGNWFILVAYGVRSHLKNIFY